MLDTGTDAERGNQGFPHGIGGADDVIAMPLQCSTQWDGLGHIFDHGNAWNGRRAGDVVTSEGDLVTGIETVAALIAGRGVLLDVGRAHRHRRRAARRLRHHRRAPRGHHRGPGRVARASAAATCCWCAPAGSPAPAGRAGATTPAAPPPACRSPPPTGCTAPRSPRIATDTWGFEVRPNEFDDAFQPLHQVAIPNIGLFLGEMWDLDALAADCAADGVYDFLLTAAPLPVTGAVGSPVNPIAVK